MATKAPSAPVRIGQYEIIRTLGNGAFGKVKLARHVITNHEVAIKIYKRESLQGPGGANQERKVRREIRILSVLKHPHIIRLYEVFETDTELYLVMEYLPGGELLDHIVSSQRLDEVSARRFFQQLVCAVEYCHRFRVVHRDLKPENLLLDEKLNLKLCDFGLSNVYADGDFLRTSCGTPHYAAPELTRGKLYAGPEVDAWSCGVILYALLCGSLPFDADNIPSLYKRIRAAQYDLPSSLPAGAANIIQRLLVTDPLTRMTLREVQRHPWFVVDLPPYLAQSTFPTRTPGAPIGASDMLEAGILPEEVADGELGLDEAVIALLAAKMDIPAHVVRMACLQREATDVSTAYKILVDHKAKHEAGFAASQPSATSPSAPHPQDPSHRPVHTPHTSSTHEDHQQQQQQQRRGLGTLHQATCLDEPLNAAPVMQRALQLCDADGQAVSGTAGYDAAAIGCSYNGPSLAHCGSVTPVGASSGTQVQWSAPSSTRMPQGALGSWSARSPPVSPSDSIPLALAPPHAGASVAGSVGRSLFGPSHYLLAQSASRAPVVRLADGDARRVGSSSRRSATTGAALTALSLHGGGSTLPGILSGADSGASPPTAGGSPPQRVGDRSVDVPISHSPNAPSGGVWAVGGGVAGDLVSCVAPPQGTPLSPSTWADGPAATTSDGTPAGATSDGAKHVPAVVPVADAASGPVSPTAEETDRYAVRPLHISNDAPVSPDDVDRLVPHWGGPQEAADPHTSVSPNEPHPHIDPLTAEFDMRCDPRATFSANDPSLNPSARAVLAAVEAAANAQHTRQECPGFVSPTHHTHVDLPISPPPRAMGLSPGFPLPAETSDSTGSLMRVAALEPLWRSWRLGVLLVASPNAAMTHCYHVFDAIGLEWRSPLPFLVLVRRKADPAVSPLPLSTATTVTIAAGSGLLAGTGTPEATGVADSASAAAAGRRPAGSLGGPDAPTATHSTPVGRTGTPTAPVASPPASTPAVGMAPSKGPSNPWLKGFGVGIKFTPTPLPSTAAPAAAPTPTTVAAASPTAIGAAIASALSPPGGASSTRARRVPSSPIVSVRIFRLHDPPPKTRVVPGSSVGASGGDAPQPAVVVDISYRAGPLSDAMDLATDIYTRLQARVGAEHATP